MGTQKEQGDGGRKSNKHIQQLRGSIRWRQAVVSRGSLASRTNGKKREMRRDNANLLGWGL